MAMKHCPDCGEKYSDTYKSCPFCEEERALQEGRKIRRRTVRNDKGERTFSLITPTLIVLITSPHFGHTKSFPRITETSSPIITPPQAV